MSKPKSKYYDLMFVNGRATKEYSAWCGMQHRRGASYKDVIVSPYFLDKEEGFARFISEVGVCPDASFDLDRRDNVKGYEPGNLRWVSRQTNLSNRSITLTVLNYDDSVESLVDFCIRTHRNYLALKQRYRVRKTIVLHASELV